MKGNLIIISSPSGGGKGTLIKEVLERVPNLGYSVSLTTRPPRLGEGDARHYHFVSKEEFENEIANGGFLEYAEVHGNLYGTARSQVQGIMEAGRDVILEIDVQGAESVMEQLPNAVSVFILPPSYETLRARLTARATERTNDLEVRLKNSHFEVSRYNLFKYVIINDEVHAAAGKLASIIVAERQRCDRQLESIQGILDSFERSNV